MFSLMMQDKVKALNVYNVLGNSHFDNPDLELSCTVYNLNAPENRELLEKSEVLYGYTFFVNRVNANKENGMELEQAIDEAIDACTRENILQDFFRTYKNEVRRIMALDFTFERQIELTKMEYYQDGFADGEVRGETRGMARGEKNGQLQNMISLIVRKLRKGKSVEQIADELEEDRAMIAPICKVAEEFAPEYDEEKIFRKLISEEV